MKDTGGEIKVLTALNPQSDDGTLDAGNIIDTLGFESCVLSQLYGATGGSPTAVNDTLLVEEGAASDLSDASTVTSAGVVVTDPAAGDVQEINIDLRSLKRYIRLSSTVVFTGGSSPTIIKAASISLGQTYLNPAV